jgi:hypothetical protein
MSFFKAIVDDFREKRLWPVALALVGGLVAVPLLLPKSAAPSPVAPLPVLATPPASSATAIPVVSEQTTPLPALLGGHARDPFAAPSQSGGSTSTGAAVAGASGSSSTGTTPSTPSTGGSKSSGTSPTGSSGSTKTSTGSSKSGSSTPQVLTFAVDISFAKVGQPPKTYRKVARLTPFPSRTNPILVLLGVKSDQKTAVFLVSSSASATGKGTCVPLPSPCTFLELTTGEKERVLNVGRNGNYATYQLELTAIRLISVPEGSSTSSPTSQTGERIVKWASRFVPALRSLAYSADTGLLTGVPHPGVPGNEPFRRLLGAENHGLW